jgi:hypothetical protein
MKALFIYTFFLICILAQDVIAQYNEATGKVKMISFSVSPLASLRSEGLPVNYTNASVQVGKLWHKGIYYSLGYTYHQNNTLIKTSDRENKWNSPSFEKGHSINASVELKKLIFSNGGNPKTGLKCFYKNIGILISPEYQYLFPIDGYQNSSRGEFSLRSGIYYHQGSTKKHKHLNFMYSIYYKKAFTPLMIVETPIGKKEYLYDEVGVRIVLLLKKLYRFDNFNRK